MPEVDLFPERFSCGANAVYLLLRLESQMVDFSNILSSAPGSEGVSLATIAIELERFGLPSDIVTCRPDELREIPPPYIMFTRAPRDPAATGHFVVVVALIGDTLKVLDGTTGLEDTYQLPRIENIWEGILIVPQRNSLSMSSLLWLSGGLLLAAGLWRMSRA